MSEIVIKVPVPDELMPLFADMDMIVTPGTDFEIGQFAVALARIDETLELTLRSLKTLAQVMETRGIDAADILKTVAMLLEPNRLAGEQIDYVRTILGRSARVGRQDGGKGVMQ